MLGFVRAALPSFANRARMACARHVATLGVLESGEVSLDPERLAPVLERAPASGSQVRALYLNRPAALHALSLTMVRRLHARLRVLGGERGAGLLVLGATGAGGRAFCAGGDIKALHAGGLAPAVEFFRAEYSLNCALARSPKHVLALLDGIVMGGGVGLSAHGRFRVATENTVFAMPECSIGLHPDVGTSYLLPRLPGALGRYLAVTGARLRGRDVHTAGIATHYVESQHLDALVQRLESVDVSTASAVEKVLAEFEEVPESTSLPYAEMIDECFGKDSIEEIVEALHRAEAEANDDGAVQFAQKARAAIAKGSPSSVKATLESVTRGKNLSIEECLDMEFRLSVRCALKPDLYEGIRAAVIDRSKPAVWKPGSLEEVSREDVLAYFAPLDTDTEVPELGLAALARGDDVGADDAKSGAQMQSRL